MRDGIIYGVSCLCHPEEGIRYVGQTVISVSSRRYVHLWNAKTETSKSYKSYLSNWIRKHGEANVVFSEVDRTTENSIDELEDQWITKLRDEGQKLVNVKAGGGQARGHKKPAHSKSMAGSNNPMYGKDRRELMAYARSFQGPPSDKTKAIWSEQRKGEGNGRSELTEEIVRHLRTTRTGAYGEVARWAKEYNVSPQTIYLAVNYKTWKHVE